MVGSVIHGAPTTTTVANMAEIQSIIFYKYRYIVTYHSAFFVLVLERLMKISKLYPNRTTIHINGRNIYKTFLWQPWAGVPILDYPPLLITPYNDGYLQSFIFTIYQCS